MRKALFLLCCIFIFPVCLSAKFAGKEAGDTTIINTLANESFPRYRLRYPPFRFLFREPAIGLELRKTYSFSHEFQAGFVYPQPLLGFMLYENFLTLSTARYMGPMVGYSWRRWKKHRSGYDKFLMLSATYRSLWFNNQWIWLGGASGSSYISNLNLSQRRQDLLLEIAFHGPATMPKRVMFEAGLGVMIIYTKSYLHDCTNCNRSDPYFEGRLRSLRESLYAPEGFFAIPWVHFSLSVPVALKRK